MTSEKIAPKYVTDVGRYNTLPKPIRESSIHEFLHTYAHETPLEESRQIMGEDKDYLKGKGTYIPVKVLWFENCAFVVTMPKDWGQNEQGGIIYNDLPRYYKVGCDHEFVALNVKEAAEIGVTHFGRCYHVEKCQKCGLVTEYESSD